MSVLGVPFTLDMDLASGFTLVLDFEPLRDAAIVGEG